MKVLMINKGPHVDGDDDEAENEDEDDDDDDDDDDEDHHHHGHDNHGCVINAIIVCFVAVSTPMVAS